MGIGGGGVFCLYRELFEFSGLLGCGELPELLLRGERYDTSFPGKLIVDIEYYSQHKCLVAFGVVSETLHILAFY